MILPIHHLKRIPVKDVILTQRPTYTCSPNVHHDMQTKVIDLIPYCSVHSHNTTCTKYSDPLSCRFHYPREIVPLSVFEGEEIKIKRLHPWINNFEPTTLVCLKCNNDIQFLGSGKAANAAAFYATQYQTKSGVSTHNTIPKIAKSLKATAIGHGSLEHVDTLARSQTVVVKCVDKVTSEREVSATQIESLLLGGEDKHCSHNFRTLNILSFLSQLPEENENLKFAQQSYIQKTDSAITC